MAAEDQAPKIDVEVDPEDRTPTPCDDVPDDVCDACDCRFCPAFPKNHWGRRA